MDSEDDESTWIVWICPECGEDHEDPEFYSTHCRKCGLVVMTVAGLAISKGWHVDVNEPSYRKHE
jgi:transcription initiation factor TFIIIB Brf1 subunit/transcription initiation factor TFIIB